MSKKLPPLAYFLVPALLVAFIQARAADPPPESPAAAVKAFVGAHTRMVWLQDGEDPPHPWGGPKMRLMVLDTDDGKGIHPLFPDIAAYSWPYATPDGKGIIFNIANKPDKPDDRQQCVMYVNWDGSGLKKLLGPTLPGGLIPWCSCVVQDPSTSTIWFYCELVTSGTTRPVTRFHGSKRFRLDNPSISEPVYDHYLGRACASPDGKLYAGVYEDEGGAPTGVYDIANATWHFIAKGCQPYLLPCVNPYRYWVCDGGHRGGRLYTNPTINGQTTFRHFDLRNAPNMGRVEVRYPHWSNDIHFMAVDSPYPIQSGFKADQCHKTEICLAKFDAGLTKIEKWLQVTNNNVGDYFASTWIDTSALPKESAPPENQPPVASSTPAATPSVSTMNTVATTAAPVVTAAGPVRATAAASNSGWPGNKTGLVYVWENSASGNEIIDPTGKHSLCIPEARVGAIVGHYEMMDVAGGSFCAKPETTATLLDGCRRSGSFSIEVEIHPDQGTTKGSLISFSNSLSRNFSLGIEANNLVLHLRTTLSTGDAAINLGVIRTAGPQHIVVTLDKGMLTSYLNGRVAALSGDAEGGIQAWTPASLIFGDEYSRGHNWAGSMQGIAIYSRALSAQEVTVHYAAAAARIAQQKPIPRVEVSAILKDITPNATPESILPYHRLLVVDNYEVQSVLSGVCDARTISIAHWGILDDRVLALDREKGKTYNLVLESMSDNPQLESECTHNDSTDVTLPVYYEVNRHLDKLPPKPLK